MEPDGHGIQCHADCLPQAQVCLARGEWQGSGARFVKNKKLKKYYKNPYTY